MSILPHIHAPEDVRRLKQSCLHPLAEEIRQCIIETTAQNGGHLASNLGMVEATIALHRVFSCPDDALLFDVSHQAYAHKLLTGRYDRFHTLRQAGGLSGFTNREESPYDSTTAGHSGSAVSAAIGLAEANRLAGRDNWVVAVVGDGSFTNGMVYEALNQLADRPLRLIILLNDNEMSISRNVGGLSAYLSYIRTSEGYFNFKIHAKQAMEALPVVGDSLVRGAKCVRDTVKRLTNSETWFESFGLKYIGPVDGNDIDKMVQVLTAAKAKVRPVIVHMKTKKGLGYLPSEEHPERFHSIGSAHAPAASSMSFDEFAGQELLAAAEKDPAVCALTAAMTDGCGLGAFRDRFPDRFFDVGIAEEHQIAMAGGLSMGGMKPAAVVYSTFAQRVFDQIWHDAALQRIPMQILLSHAGLVPGDGVTHQGLYDVGLFACIPGIRIYSPDTFAAWKEAFAAARVYPAVSVLRYPKGGEAVYPASLVWKKADGEAQYRTAVIGTGDRRLAVLTYGRITAHVAEAAAALVQERPDLRVDILTLTQIFPLPFDAPLLNCLQTAEQILVVEEHARTGGLGEKIAADARMPRRPVLAAVEEPWIPHGDPAYLERFCHLDAASLTERMRALLPSSKNQ